MKVRTSVTPKRSADAFSDGSYARQESPRSITDATIGLGPHAAPERQRSNNQAEIHGERERQRSAPDGKHVCRRSPQFDHDMTNRAR